MSEIDQPATPDDSRTRWLLVAGALAIIAALVAVLVVINTDDDDGDATTTEPTDTTVISESTTAPTTTPPATTAPETTEPPVTEPDSTTPPSTDPVSTEAPEPPDDVRAALWPWAATDTRYADPVEAATGFATDFLGFDTPIVGEFRAGDAQSGEVQIRSFETGPATVAFVRQLTDDGSWWILGAASANITIDEPETGAEVTSPLTVSGTVLAFEGTVDVELRADGNGEPIFDGFVSGSGGSQPGPYREVLEFGSPGATGGALVMLSRSSEDGSVVEAAAVRIFYR